MMGNYYERLEEVSEDIQLFMQSRICRPLQQMLSN